MPWATLGWIGLGVLVWLVVSCALALVVGPVLKRRRKELTRVVHPSEQSEPSRD